MAGLGGFGDVFAYCSVLVPLLSCAAPAQTPVSQDLTSGRSDTRMLQSLREHASSWIVKILFGFLILSFGLWGINDIFMGERDPTVAKVGGTKITFNQLNDAVRQQMARFAPVFGGMLDRDQARQL